MERIIIEIDKAKAAGLFMGEGCISVERRYNTQSGSRRIQVRVVMCDYEVVHWLQEYWPGYFFSQISKNPKHRTKWTWKLTARKAEKFLKDIQVYVIGEKAPQINLALEFLSRQFPPGKNLTSEQIDWEEFVYSEMKKLKRPDESNIQQVA